MAVIYATTFSADLWESSGKNLLVSFLEHQHSVPDCRLAVYAEGLVLPGEFRTDRVDVHDITAHPFLTGFLGRNADVIPRPLGGKAVEPYCRCKGGPFGVHSGRHRLPCVGYWFCKNAFRWLRKVLAASLAAEAYSQGHDKLMWVDSDARFLAPIPDGVVDGWFVNRAGVIYLKSRRTEIETGVVGYHLRRGGRKVLARMLGRYETGVFRSDPRWDDCRQLGAALRHSKDVVAVDLATRVGPNNTVIQFSPLRDYLGHDKGHHRRTGKLS